MTGRARGLVVVVLGAVLLVAGWLLTRPAGEGGRTRELPAPPEDTIASDPTVAHRAIARARARVASEPVSDDLQALPGRVLWLCAYSGRSPPHPEPTPSTKSLPRCAEGQGDTLADAVDRAAEALVRAGKPPPSVLWKVDWELSRAGGSWPADAHPHEAGTVGLAVDGAVILPSEVLERDLFVAAREDDPAEYDHAAIRRLLTARGATISEPFDVDLIRTASWVEPEPGAAPIQTYRTHAWDPVVVEDPDQVLTRAVWAAEALSRTVGADGRIEYLWDVSEGREKKGSNLLRHAGSTYSLIQAWDRTGHPPWRASAERALDFMISRSATDERVGPYGGGKGRYLVEGSHIKLGGAGLALVALSTWQAATGDTSRAEQAREFATFLVSQQQQSGEFVYFPPKIPGGEPKPDTSAYYPGEAVLGLVLWSSLDPEPSDLWLQTARRGADWLIDVRDAGKGPSRLENDHWLMISLHRLHVATRDPRYQAHALRLAEAVRHQQQRQAGHERYHRDYRGGYYEPPRSTPASTRAEGLVAVLDLLAERGTSDPVIHATLLDTVRHLSQAQYLPETVYWTPRPSRVAGHMAGGILHPDLRNDFTQHALSALLGTERILRRDAGSAMPERPAVERILAPIQALEAAVDSAEPSL